MPTDRYGKYTCMSSSICNRGKAEAACHHHRLASYISTWCSCTLQSYILQNISLCYYLPVQLMYHNELYRECSGTSCACANSGNRSSSTFCVEHLGMRLAFYMKTTIVGCHGNDICFITIAMGELSQD